jgi:hypothetical protein
MSELAWAAGLFEGEGSIIPEKNLRPAALSMGSTDKDVLERFAAAVGAGAILGPYRGQGSRTPQHYKPMFAWKISGIYQIQAILRLFWPYLGERRRSKAAEVIASYYLSDRPRLPQRRNHRAVGLKE